MNGIFDFNQWLTELRFSRSVCMLIPMEASMGIPVAVKSGKEFIIPFFRTASAENTDILYPPFAYLRVSCPEARVLTYNSLSTMPEWRDIAPDAAAGIGRYADTEEYYRSLACREADTDRLDELLLGCLGSTDMTDWYKRLIGEAKKYR